MMTQTQPDGKGRPAISGEREDPAAAYTKATMTIQQFYRPTWQDHGEWIDYYQVPRSRARRTLRNLRRRNPGLQFRALPTEADPDDTRQEATPERLQFEREHRAQVERDETLERREAVQAGLSAGKETRLGAPW